MRKENVKVIVWGLGAMGKGVVEMLLSRKRCRCSWSSSKGRQDRKINV